MFILPFAKNQLKCWWMMFAFQHVCLKWMKTRVCAPETTRFFVVDFWSPKSEKWRKFWWHCSHGDSSARSTCWLPHHWLFHTRPGDHTVVMRQFRYHPTPQNCMLQSTRLKSKLFHVFSWCYQPFGHLTNITIKIRYICCVRITEKNEDGK